MESPLPPVSMRLSHTCVPGPQADCEDTHTAVSRATDRQQQEKQLTVEDKREWNWWGGGAGEPNLDPGGLGTSSNGECPGASQVHPVAEAPNRGLGQQDGEL